VAEIMIQDSDARRTYRARLCQPIELDYHDGIGRFGIEAVAEDGRIVLLYLSMIEACGLSAAFRSEIGAASEAIAERSRRGYNCGNAIRPIRYNSVRR
jgi:hypothetical protein